MAKFDDIKIVRSKRHSIALYVLPGGTIEVRAPRLVPGFIINSFLNKHKDWIEEKRSTIKTIKKTKRFEEGEKLVYLGNELVIKFGNYTKIQIQKSELLFPYVLKFRVDKEIENWLKAQSKQIITNQVIILAKELKTTFVSIRFSDTSSKWGSCTSDNRLQFNWRLVMAPLLVLRYVVVHELAHTKEKNHSRAFWSKVAEINPSYKQQIKWLKERGDKLIL